MRTLSYDAVKKIITSKFKQVNGTNENFSEASNIGLFSTITSSLMSYLFYVIKMETRENYFDTVLDPKNLVKLARNYSYSVGRPSSPIVTLEYLGRETANLVTNQSFGTIKSGDIEYGLYYGGGLKQIEYGDKIDVRVGVLKQMEIPMKNGLIKQVITPTQLEAVDNDYINIGEYATNGNIISFHQVSPSLEDFVSNKPSQISKDKTSAEVFISDNSKDKRHGIITSVYTGSFKVFWLETKGYEHLNKEDIKINNSKYGIIGVSSFGMSSETDESIRDYAKFLYLSNKRMITPTDHTAILSNFPQFKKVNTVRDIGKPRIVRLSIDSLNVLKTQKVLEIGIGESDITGQVNNLSYRVTLLPYKNRPFNYFYAPNSQIDYKYYTPDDNFYNTRLNEAYKYFEHHISEMTTRVQAVATIDEANALNSYITLTIEPKLKLHFDRYWKIDNLQKGVEPQGCCSFFVYYIHQMINGSTPIILTSSEMRAISERTKAFKGNSQLIFIPAQPEIIDLEIAYTAYDNADNDKIKGIIEEIVEKEINYTMNKPINDSILVAIIHNKLNLEGLSLVSLKVNSPFNYSAQFLSARFLYVNRIIFG